ncbi:SMP-30/gluconolactonase/LRE family protein [Sphingobium sp. EM0848]|uniref:SMP-30/gluconolactonase/LRE family protein n=1 Tax=Sphingobium sp. EM0848 TaxID=2743473 RepID=UPI00159C33DA|nr:SMP-30/gluconolactonase/LRE family protein [Sphingobium sp. EM0848]
MEVVAEGLLFPEGPVALPDGSVLVVETQRGTLSRVAPTGDINIVAELGGGPNGAALGPDGWVYICNNGGFEWHDHGGALIPGDLPVDYIGGSIQRVHLDSGAVETLYTECDGRSLRGPNDLVFDAHGGFWFTDHGKATADGHDHGRIFYAKADGSAISCALDRLHGPNGIGLSPDGATLYFAETPTARFWACDVVAPGRLGPAPAPWMPARLVATMPGYQLFDSLKVEADGHVCVGTLINGGITIFEESGASEHLAFPELAITNLCFGGEDMRDVWATASSSGRLYRTRWARPGLLLEYQSGTQSV